LTLYLAAGKLKDTNRYKESHKILRVAKEKYKPINTTVSGHSLGGSIAGYIASKGDKVFTLDKGATLFQPVKKNEKAYRSSGDLVSLLNANSKHVTTLKNNNFQTGIIPLDALNSHNVNNIKDKKIFV
jgi:predicted alpha/beta-fold hydrolase